MIWFAVIIIGILGFLVAFVFSIWHIVTAFKESRSCGLLSLFVPFYGFYYTISRWEKTKKSTIVAGIGVVVFILAIFIPLTIVKSNITPIVNGFIIESAQGNLEEAYSYWTSRTDKEKVYKIVDEFNIVFTEFKDISIDNVGLSWHWDGSIEGKCQGHISYGDDAKIHISVTLVNEQGKWEITRLTLYPPLSMFLNLPVLNSLKYMG